MIIILLLSEVRQINFKDDVSSWQKLCGDFLFLSVSPRSPCLPPPSPLPNFFFPPHQLKEVYCLWNQSSAEAQPLNNAALTPCWVSREIEWKGLTENPAAIVTLHWSKASLVLFICRVTNKNSAVFHLLVSVYLALSLHTPAKSIKLILKPKPKTLTAFTELIHFKNTFKVYIININIILCINI